MSENRLEKGVTMKFEIVFTKQAAKDFEKIAASPFKKKVARLLEVLEENPFQPPYERLLGDLSGAFSRRINLQHRLVYSINEEKKCVIILRMWTHYGDN